ncbi:hypothetical protein [Sphingosinicella terrae]|uniref:hypothetical protein n=1 Tax=Sphingosinicella terrae TaxID=2172047 RepID=UPI0013B3893D|nr:hypothetical protein [Sphingosinicella terrae]
MLRYLIATLALISLSSLCAGRAQAQADAQAAVESLLAADRGFSAAAAQSADALAALSAMFDAAVVVPVPGRGLVSGRETVLAVYRDVPGWREGRLRWTPVRAGISADGMHGFTYGFATLAAGDPARRERKYLSYWIRRPEGWRVVAYRQVPRAAGEVSTEMMPASLPGFTDMAVTGEVDVETHRRSLAAAEQAFSDRAQEVGLRTAFFEFGRDDAMNMSGGAGFRIGREAISAGMPEGSSSPLRWSTEMSFVAASGDLGVSIGTIHANAPPPEGQPASIPFFTIWRRDAADQPWRYIAE